MQVLMPPFLGPFSSLARFALTGYLPIITPWEGYGVNPVLNNQTVFTTKNPFSEIREKRLVRASGWAQAARRALEYVQVRQAKYRGMSPPTARRGRQGPRQWPMGPPSLPLRLPGRVRVYNIRSWG